MSGARTLWEEGREPGRQVVALGSALVLTLVALDVGVGGDRVTSFFDVGFVLVCVAVALLVRPADFFTVGVLPPLLMLLAFAVLALTHPLALAPPRASATAADAAQAVVGGLAGHAVALAVGYALCLGCLALRARYVRAGAAALTPGSGPRPPRPPAAPRAHPR